jgi:hypothetical protein
MGMVEIVGLDIFSDFLDVTELICYSGLPISGRPTQCEKRSFAFPSVVGGLRNHRLQSLWRYLEITGSYQKTSVALVRAGEEALRESGLNLHCTHCTSSEGSLK